MCLYTTQHDTMVHTLELIHSPVLSTDHCFFQISFARLYSRSLQPSRSRTNHPPTLMQMPSYSEILSDVKTVIYRCWCEWINKYSYSYSYSYHLSPAITAAANKRRQGHKRGYSFKSSFIDHDFAG
jgi:hypothetical protein